jgi:hypothetical protein
MRRGVLDYEMIGIININTIKNKYNLKKLMSHKIQIIIYIWIVIRLFFHFFQEKLHFL